MGGGGTRGTLQHRVLDCPRLQCLREECGPATLADVPSDRVPWQVRDAFTTCLFPLNRLQMSQAERPPTEGTFEWVLEQQGYNGHVGGVIYTDGSRRFNHHPDTQRLGWSLVVLDKCNHVVAIARGATPDYVDDIPGAEAWAILQAAAIAAPGSVYRSDCKPCVDAIHAGRAWACAANRPLARIYKQLFHHIDDVPAASFVWMPSHTSAANVDRTRLSNGKFLSHTDRRANALADKHAKIAAASFAVSRQQRDKLREQDKVVTEAARWLGWATWAATHDNDSGGRDSVASRAAAEAVRRRRSNHDTAKSRRGREAGRGPSLREDQSVQQRAAAWTEAAAARGPAVRHQLMISGQVVWCNVCGTFGSQRGRGLAHSCPGPVQVGGTGGRSQQLRRLRAGFHPKDRVSLPAAIPRAEWTDDELSHAQRAMATALWHLEPQNPEGEANADDEAQHDPRHREGPHDGDAKEDDSVAEVLIHTEYGRMCLRHRGQKRPVSQPAISEAQIRLRGIRARVREREHSGHSNDQFELTQELTAVLATTTVRDDLDSSAVRRATERQSADRDHSPASQAHEAPEITGQCDIPIRPARATAAEQTELRDLRRRQAQCGGHPIGYSAEEPQLFDEEEDQLADYHRWIAEGRPEVVVRGRPGPGAWDHPWVVYRVEDEHVPATKRARGGDSRGSVITPPRPNDAQLDTMEVDGGMRPCIPPLPVMTADVLAQLEAVLPPPEATPPSPSAASTARGPAEAGLAPHESPGCKRAISSSATHDSEHAHQGASDSTATVGGRPDGDYNHVCDGGVALPDTGQYRTGATLVQLGTKRNATAMHSPLDDGCQASSKRARIGSVGSRSHSDTLALARRINTTTTTTGADRAAPTATPGSAT